MRKPSVSFGSSSMVSGPRTSILARIVQQSLLLTVASVLLLSLLSAIVARSLLVERVTGQISAAATAREELLAQTIAFNREQTSIVAARSDIKALLNDGSPRARAVLQQLLKQLSLSRMPAVGIALFDSRLSLRSLVGKASPAPQSVSAATIVMPIVDEGRSWVANDVYAPILDSNDKVIGMVAIQYDISSLLAVLSDNQALGKEAKLWLGVEKGKNVIIVYGSLPEDLAKEFVNAREQGASSSLPLAMAAAGQEGLYTGFDEEGKYVFAAYRFIPSLGWGMVLKADGVEVLGGFRKFVTLLLVIDVFLLLLSGVLAFSLARRLTSPLLRLAAAMQSLRPGKWKLHSMVHTGDEVEILEQVAVDLTKRLQATYDRLEEAVETKSRDLRKQYLLDRTILERIEYGVLVFDKNAVITDLNPAAAHFLLLHRQNNAIGKKATDLLRLFAKGKPLSEKLHPVTRSLVEGAKYHSVHTTNLSLQRKDDTLLPIALSVIPLLDGQRTLGVIAILRDMREENRIDAMKSEFITLASHQLRTPLAAIRWYVELLRNEKSLQHSRTEREYVGEIDRSSHRMADLLDDLLHITRLEGGEIIPERRKFDLTELLKEFVEEWKHIAVQKHASCTALLPSSKVEVVSDPVLLRLVFQNLFTNAVKYSAHHPVVRAKLTCEKNEAVIEVEDNGIGIPPEEQAHIFEKFFRARNAQKAAADGTGLGLYLVKTIVENVRGKISFTSHPGKGTTFTIRLPLA